MKISATWRTYDKKKVPAGGLEPMRPQNINFLISGTEVTKWKISTKERIKCHTASSNQQDQTRSISWFPGQKSLNRTFNRCTLGWVIFAKKIGRGGRDNLYKSPLNYLLKHFILLRQLKTFWKNYFIMLEWYSKPHLCNVRFGRSSNPSLRIFFNQEV